MPDNDAALLPVVLERIHTELSSLGGKVDVIGRDVSQVRSEITGTKEEIKGLRLDLSKHDKRISVLEEAENARLRREAEVVGRAQAVITWGAVAKLGTVATFLVAMAEGLRRLVA